MDHFRRIYKNHGNSIGYWEGRVEGAVVTMTHAKSIDGSPVDTVYLAKGKNMGRANATTDAQQAILELESRTKKKLDKGYVLTIDAAKKPVTNSLGLAQPMLATPIDKINPGSIEWDSTFVQPKLDGHRCLYKDGMLYSRGGKEILMPHILEAIKDSPLDGMHLDGELYNHGTPLQVISKLIKKPRPESVQIQYHIYDVVENSFFNLRHFKLQSAMDALSSSARRSLKNVETIPVKNMEEVLELHANYRESGYEGTMLRFGYENYPVGKRSRKLLKIKEFQDSEFCIMGYKQGKPYIRGSRSYRVPVWECAVGDASFDVTAPGSMEEKEEAWLARDTYIGRMLTVKYHYLSEKGIPQLPVGLQYQEAF
jgi:DNA ligase-1